MPGKLTKAFFNEVRSLIVSARATVARGVDLVQVYTNFEIGRRIVWQEQEGKGRAAYGEEVLKALADRLTAEFGNGFSQRNLASMRTFYLLYRGRKNILQSATAKLPASQKSQSATGKLPGSKKSQSAIGKSAAGKILQSASAKSEASQKGQTLSGRLETPPPPRPFTLSWTHYVFLLGIKNPDERSFYEIEAASGNWTVRELKRQFDSSLYERLALSRDKKGVRRLGTSAVRNFSAFTLPPYYTELN